VFSSYFSTLYSSFLENGNLIPVAVFCLSPGPFSNSPLFDFLFFFLFDFFFCSISGAGILSPGSFSVSIPSSVFSILISDDAIFDLDSSLFVFDFFFFLTTFAGSSFISVFCFDFSCSCSLRKNVNFYKNINLPYLKFLV